MDHINDLTMKIAGPIAKLAQYPSIASIQNGLVSIMPVIIVGSSFLILYVLGSPSVGDSGKALLPFLAPWADKFSAMNSLTMNFLGLYASVTIAMSYAKFFNIEAVTSAVLGLASYLILNLAAPVDGMIPVNNFSASGLIVAIITSLISVRIYKFFIDKNITIKLPDSVPPAIGNAFSSLIPFVVIFTLCWIVRTILEFDLVAWMNSALAPLFSAADNMGIYSFKMFMANLLWSVGLHGDNMWSAPIFQPFELMWTAENAAALANGVSGYDLPHIMTNSGIDRISNWTSTVWPLVILMVTSKVKYLRTLGWVCLPPAIFTIVEPVIFGLPLALNPYLIFPFLLITIIVSIVTYGAFALKLVKRFFITLPWATPPFILGPLGTQDWKVLALIAVDFLIGFIIYYPFWKQFEKAELEKEKENEEAALA